MTDIVGQLRQYLSDYPMFEEAFKGSFEIAKGMEKDIPQFAEYNIHSFNDFIDFYDMMLSWTPSENSTGTNVYNHLCMFYFIIDLDPVKRFQTPIEPTSLLPGTWLSDWLVRYAIEMGKFMDTPESINAETLATFYQAENYHMADYPVPPGGWTTFNEFFARHINPDVRRIDSIDDPTVIVSPADSTFDGSWPIDSNGSVTFSAKGIPWSIGELLQDSGYGERFKDGIFMHSFLAPFDYHRQHAPVAGTVVEAKVIPGVCYLQVGVEKDADGNWRLCMQREMRECPLVNAGVSHSPLDLVAPNEPGYQFLQARGLIVLDNPDIGLVAVLPIGMAQISSVVLSVKKNDVLQKGDEISYFQCGGSDVVVVFEAASQVKITAAKEHYHFGKQIATAKRISK